MKQIGIIQPGRLGDIIICLPIAKYYYDKGYNVTWPIFTNYYEMIKAAVDYVNFIPVTNDVYKTVAQTYNVLKNNNIDNIIDIAATFPGSICTDEYVKLGDGFGQESFDEFKYRKANVPFANKWNLHYNRKIDEEELVFKKIVNVKDYDIVGTNYSGGSLDIKFESKTNIINFTNDFSIFHWRKVFENAQTIALVDSAMANFIEQIGLPNKKILICLNKRPRPKFKNDWKIINL